MMYFVFVIAAFITVISAVKLSTYADVLSERSSLGGMFVGTLLLAGATSLPEVTTSATAVFVNNPDIAVGNILGSNLFNIFILAIADFIYRKRRMMTLINKDHLSTAFISLGLSALVFLSIIYPTGITFLNIGIESYLLVIFYIISMKLVSKNNDTQQEAAATTEPLEKYKNDNIPLTRAKYGFIIFAIVIFISGSLLTISGDSIAASTGINSSFIGSFLIAGATSLPELVTVLMSIKLLNYNLAVGNILGSNVFNMLIIVVTDALYQNGSILAGASPISSITALAFILLNIIVIFTIIFWKSDKKSKLVYSLPSILLMVFYFLSSVIIFSFNS